MNLSPTPIQKFFDKDGAPLVGGLLFVYAAGTTTKVNSFQDSTGTVNTNPVVMNFRGECRLWLDSTQSYKMVLSPATDTDPPTNPIWTVDNITVQPPIVDNSAVDSGTANNVVLSIPQLPPTPVAFTRVVFKAAATNTGATVLAINGGTAKAVTWQDLSALTGGELQANGVYEAIYDATRWQLQSPILRPPVDCRRFGVSPSASAAINAAAFNSAAAFGGLVYLEAPGTYVVDDNIDLISNTLFRIGPGVTIQGAAAKAWLDTGIVDISGRSNVCVQLFGTIDGNKANNATGRAFGIRVNSSTDVLIQEQGSVINCPGTSSAGTLGGDGIYVGGAGTARVTVKDVLLSSNVRQGMSFVRGEDLIAIGVRVFNTSGTDPGSGIDCEADAPGNLKRVKIIGCSFDGNYRAFQAADCDELQVLGCMMRNSSYQDAVIIRVTDLKMQAEFSNVNPSVAEIGTISLEQVEDFELDLNIWGNYDAQQGNAIAIREGTKRGRITAKVRNCRKWAMQIGTSAMAEDIEDINVIGGVFNDISEPSENVGVILLDGNSGGGFYPRRITITGNVMYDTRTGGNEATAGVQCTTSIPNSVLADYNFGNNTIKGPTSRYINCPNEGSFNRDLTGMTGTVTTTVSFKVSDGTASMRCSTATGTSNTNAMQFSVDLPEYLRPTQTHRGLCTGVDNGTTQTLTYQVTSAGVTSFNLASTGALTNVNGKGLQTTTLTPYQIRP